MKDQEKLVTIREFLTNVEASMARDILENEGISCMLTNETISSIYPIGNTSLGGIQLLVFEKDMEGLKQACVTLGGVQGGRGDVAYRIPMFEFLPVQFAFWQSDEDFPADVQLLWDKNVLDYMHYETLWYAAGHLMKRLEDRMKGGIS